jgi:hypothetical protein
MKLFNSSNASTKLIAISMSFAICTFYIVKFVENTFVAIFLSLYNIPYKWSLLNIKYLTRSTTYWNEGNTVVIYGITQALIIGLGIWLLSYLFKKNTLSWLQRFFLTWLVFAMVNNAFSGILSGSFLFDRFGYAFFWLIPSLLPRLIIAAFFLLIYLGLSNFWGVFFLTASYSSSLIQGPKNQRKYIVNAVLIPLSALILVSALFNLPQIDRYEVLQTLYPFVYIIPMLIFIPEPGRIKLASKGRLSVNVQTLGGGLILSLVILRLLNMITL